MMRRLKIMDPMREFYVANARMDPHMNENDASIGIIVCSQGVCVLK
jgi:hypothetical protein